MSLKSVTKSALTNVFAINDVAKIIAAVDKADVVSFDIFDTLIKRNVARPHDIHDVVARRAPSNLIQDKANWRNVRVNAEHAARKATSNEEITLGEIYAQIGFLSDEQRKELMGLEEATELDYCVANPPLKSVYEHALSTGKHVIITSDMYLSRSIIEQILKNAGFTGYEKLFLSSELMLTKQKGSVFNLLKETYPKPQVIFHIGDNPRGDYLSALFHGLDAVLIDED